MLWARTSFCQGCRPTAQKAGACSTGLTNPALKSCQQLAESQGRASAVILFLSQELNKSVTSRNRLLSDAGKLLLEPSLPTGTHTEWLRLETQGCQPSAALSSRGGGEAEAADTFQQYLNYSLRTCSSGHFLSKRPSRQIKHTLYYSVGVCKSKKDPPSKIKRFLYCT